MNGRRLAAVPAAVSSAVAANDIVDALRPPWVRDIALPATPERVRQAIRDAPRSGACEFLDSPPDRG